MTSLIPLTAVGDAVTLPRPGQQHYDFLNVGLVCVSVVNFSFNIPVVVSLALSRQLHNPAFIFLLALAFADISVALSCLAKVALPLDKVQQLCLVYMAFFMAPACASMLFMFWIAVDRLVAISNALTYHQKVTRPRACVVVTLTWIYAFLVGCGPLMGGRNRSFTRCSYMYVVHRDYIWVSFTIGYLLPLICIIVIYSKIFVVTRTHIKKISTQESVFTSENLATQNLSMDVEKGAKRNPYPEVQHRRRVSRLRRTLKAVRTLGIVIGCFVVTWFPFTITSLVQNACGAACHLEDLVGTYLLLLGCLNSCLNPVIYAFWNKDFQQSVKSSFRFCLVRRTTVKPMTITPIAVISRSTHRTKL